MSAFALSFYIMIPFSFINSTHTLLKQNKLELIFSQAIFYPFPLHLLDTRCIISSNHILDRRSVYLLHGKDLLTSGKCFFPAVNSSKGDVTYASKQKETGNPDKQKMEVKFIL